MIAAILHILLTAVIMLFVSRLVPGFVIQSFGYAVLGAVVLGIINAIVRPIMVVLTFPITIVTFGLFLFVINALMLKLAAAVIPGVQVQGFVPALIAALLLAIFNTIVFAIVPVGS